MMKFNKLLFGTAGIPISTPDRNTINGIAHVKTLGLGSMELEFVRNINISKEMAKEVKFAAKKHKIVLTAHGQYFINLNSHDKEKKKASVERVLNAARRAHECGAFSMTFHAGFYQGDSPDKTYNAIKEQLKNIVKTLQDESVDIWIRPETTGKKTQFAGLKELLNLSAEIEQVMPTVDFAHMHAREAGKNNTYDEFSKMLSDIESVLGRDALNQMHIHTAGINYGDKGEKNHLNLKESDFNYQDLVKAFKDYKLKGVVISESPNIESDAQLLKETYDLGLSVSLL